MSSVEESTATEDDESTMRAVRTEQNPKLSKKKKKASSISVKPESISVKPESIRVKPESTSKKQKPVTSRASTHRYSNRRSSSPVSDSSQKSYAVLRNTTSKIIDSIYGSDEQDVEEDVRNEMEQNPQRVTRYRPSISFTSKGEESRHTRSTRSKAAQNIDPGAPDMTKEADTTLQHNRKRPLNTEDEKDQNCGIEPITEDQKRQRHHSPEVLSSEGEEKRSRDAKRRQLIDDSRANSEYVHIPAVKPELVDDTVRRSSRTRVPRINHLLGEQVVYEPSASGGLVVKEVIRPASPSSQYSIFEQKLKAAKKQKKQSSRNASQSQSSTSNSKLTTAKEKDRIIVEDTEKSAEEKRIKEPIKKPVIKLVKMPVKKLVKMPVKKSPQKASNTKKTSPSADLTSKESFGNSFMKSMFQSDSRLATESVETINNDGTVRPPVVVVKPLQSLGLCNLSGSMVTPNDPFIMAILSRQKYSNYGIAILNEMGDKGEQYTSNCSVCFFLISGEIMVKIGDLELHPPVWSKIYIPQGVTYTLRNLQHTPAVLSYMVIKPNKDHD